MTNEQKIKKLTGATAAVIDATTHEFAFFTDADAHLAKDLLDGVSDGSITMGVSILDARLFFYSPESNVIWKFADRKLAALAK